MLLVYYSTYYVCISLHLNFNPECHLNFNPEGFVLNHAVVNRNAFVVGVILYSIYAQIVVLVYMFLKNEATIYICTIICLHMTSLRVIRPTWYPGSFHYAPRWRIDPGPGWSRVSQIFGDNNWDLWGVGKANVAFEFKTIQGG